MIRKIVTLLAALSITTAAAGAEVWAGVRGIMQLSAGSSVSDDMKDSTISKIKTSSEISGGGAAYIHVPIGEIGLAIQPEIGFTHNKTGLDFDWHGGSTDGSFAFNTINIPLLVAYDFEASRFATLTPFAGPQIGFIVGDATYKIDDEKTERSPDTSIFFSLVFGLASTFKIDFTNSIVADIRYNLGMNELEYKDKGLVTFRGLQIGLAYQIKF